VESSNVKISSLTLVFIVFFSLVLGAENGWAFGGMRSSMRNMSNAIHTQARQALKPKLVVYRNKIPSIPQLRASSDQRFLIKLIERNLFSVWDFKTGMVKGYFKSELRSISDVAINKDGSEIVITDGRSLELIDLLEESTKFIVKTGYKIHSLTLLDNKKKIIIGTNKGHMVVFDSNGKRESDVRISSSSEPISLFSSSKGNYLIAGTEGGRIQVFNVSARGAITPVKSFETYGSLTALAGNGQGVIVIGGSSGEVTTFSIDQERIIKKKSFSRSGRVTNLSISPKNSVFVTFADGTVQGFSISRHSQKIRRFKTNPALSGGTLNLANHGVSISSKKNGHISFINLFTGKGVAEGFSTQAGWALVDKNSRYDGNDAGTIDVAWEDDGKAFEIDSFSREYYEPGLLSKLTKDLHYLTEPKASIEDGLEVPPEFTIKMQKANLYFGGKNRIKIHTALTGPQSAISNMTPPQLFHNGKMLPSETEVTSGTASHGKEIEKSWTFTLRPTVGINSVFAVAYGSRGLRLKSETIEFSGIKKDRTSTLSINAIGINTYRNPDLNLNYAVADAVDMAEKFSGLSDQKYTSSIKSVFLDDKATKREILTHLVSLKDLDQEDVAIVFLSGHGLTIGKTWHFVPHEAESLENSTHVQRVGISAQELVRILVSVPAQNILLIIDSCQSGAVVDNFELFSQQRALRGVSEKTGVHILASTRADQLAPEYSILKHGLFTHTLLNGFQKNKKGRFNADQSPKDGNLTVGELKNYVERWVPILARKLEEKLHIASTSERGTLRERVPVTPVGKVFGNDFSIF
jgi:hypothetical protein